MTETGKRIGVAGCKHTTLEFIDGMRRHGHGIDQCITISPELGVSQEVAGYMDLREPMRERGIPVHVTETYALKEDRDGDAIRSLGLDLLLVIGWQRLVPDWFLDTLSIGAFGMHGSSLPLPHGRGRSPMNWSLIQDRKIFHTHLFRYNPGVDDGDVAGVQCFDITPFDTCLTLHYKNTLSMIRLVDRLLPSLLDGTAVLEPQDEEGATYYPKRTAEDGLVNWSASTAEIHNLVRAVTRPFPGAFSFLDDQEDQCIRIWKAIPFDEQLDYPDAAPGEIVAQFESGDFVARTGTSTMLVVDWEYEGDGDPGPLPGRCLGTAGREIKDWGVVPR